MGKKPGSSKKTNYRRTAVGTNPKPPLSEGTPVSAGHSENCQCNGAGQIMMFAGPGCFIPVACPG